MSEIEGEEGEGKEVQFRLDLPAEKLGGAYANFLAVCTPPTTVIVPPFPLDREARRGHLDGLRPETGIHGAGDTPTEALQDFRRAVVEHLDVLERQDALSDDLAAQLRYLRARV